MIEALCIERRRSTDNSNSYESLRREGIEAIQALSGRLWTDYNPHDPGITILEQLCYALTDLIYRADFSVEDCLADNNGQIDYERLALFSPEQVFPSRATTLQDYRKIILDAVMDIDNVWISHSALGGGLYKIAVRLNEPLDPEQSDAVLEQVRRAYLRQRNLCEDVHEIVVMNEVDCHLSAEIEVQRGRSAAEILADIYYQCAKYIGGCITPGSYEVLLQQEVALDEIYRGPWTRHGHISDADLNGNNGELLISTLFEIINAIEGVDHIKSLYVNYDRDRYARTESDGMPQATLRLRLPATEMEMGVRLSESGMTTAVLLDSLHDRYQELEHKNRVARARIYSGKELVKLPQGVFRNVADYYSVQNHFPDAYGVNRYGMPESAGDDVKARVIQLKGYLLLFEQLMANSMANFGAVKELFSLHRSDHSYAFQILDDAIIKDIDRLYPENPVTMMSAILARYDNPDERKGRLFDYLLALYGETLSLEALRHFNYYYSDAELKQNIVDCKIDYLRCIVKIGRDRAAGIDYLSTSWGDIENVAGLQQRASRQLGFKYHHTRLLVASLYKQKLRVVPHELYVALSKDENQYRLVDTRSVDNATQPQYEKVPLIERAPHLSLDELRNQLRDIEPLKGRLLSERLLQRGININHYRLVALSLNQGVEIFISVDDDGNSWYLGTYADRESATRAINTLRNFMLALNVESEGIHLLEHLLLRPVTKQYGELAQLQQEGFYNFRVSVVFPAWTARCKDRHFRHLAEQTVRESCPAHIYPEIHWLEFDMLYEFERLYKKWVGLKRDQSINATACDEAAAALTRLLIKIRA